MTALASIGTHLPVWGDDSARVVGPDEDAVTLAVAAARTCLGDSCRVAPDVAHDVARAAVDRVVLISRDLPLLDGGNAAALLAGIGLPADTVVVEQLGGAPDVLQTVGTARAGTLVVAVDLAPAGAGAVLIGTDGAEVVPAGQVTRSLPIRSRARDGVQRDYQDPRLQRERGHGAAIDALHLPGKPDVVAGLPAKPASSVTVGRPPVLPTLGASSAVFALAFAADAASTPILVRAFEPKLRWEAGRCDACGALAFPPRFRCIECGSEQGSTLAPLPREGSVYSVVTIHVPVPGLRTPYSLAIVELGDTGVRALVTVTGVPAGSVSIDDHGALVLRRVAIRNGIPDYGYAFRPDAALGTTDEADKVNAG